MTEKKARPRIAIPGWGSLIWDKCPELMIDMASGYTTARCSRSNSEQQDGWL